MCPVLANGGTGGRVASPGINNSMERYEEKWVKISEIGKDTGLGISLEITQAHLGELGIAAIRKASRQMP